MVDEAEARTPGQLLESLLGARRWTQRVLAIVLRMDETSVNRIVTDKRPIDAALAICLGELFGVDAERFLDLQKSYDLAKARLSARSDPNRAIRAHLFGDLPVAELIKRKWIAADDIRNVALVETELARFFGVESADKIEILPHAAKKTNLAMPATPAQLAWLYRVRQLAREMLVPRFSLDALQNAIRRMGALLISAENTRKIPRMLAESGVRYVIVESLSGAKIDGVCFWPDDKGPVVGMSLRFDRVDNFWFVLRHELEHVLCGHGRSAVMLDAELEGDRAGTGSGVAEEERIANEAASEFCVPRKAMDGFIARKFPLIADRDLIGFARTIEVHPGIVAGQLQHRTGRYDRFRKHLVKVREMIAPNAITDGWGDIASVET